MNDLSAKGDITTGEAEEVHVNRGKRKEEGER